MARFSPLVALPPLAFAGLAAVFYFGLSRDDASQLPSTFIGKTAPEMQVTSLRGDLPPTAADLATPGVKLVNFWASWCGPCRAEHPRLEELAAEGVPIIGINYKDQPAQALAFLAELGDPFVLIGADTSGRTGIDWGLYGVPETFVVDSQGRIVARHAGPLTVDIVAHILRPAMESAE